MSLHEMVKAMSFPLLNETWKNHLRVLLFARKSLQKGIIPLVSFSLTITKEYTEHNL